MLRIQDQIVGGVGSEMGLRQNGMKVIVLFCYDIKKIKLKQEFK
jgi:hypothetical protein